MGMRVLFESLYGAHLVYVHEADRDSRIVYVWKGEEIIEVLDVGPNDSVQFVIELRAPEANRESALATILSDAERIYGRAT